MFLTLKMIKSNYKHLPSFFFSKAEYKTLIHLVCEKGPTNRCVLKRVVSLHIIQNNFLLKLLKIKNWENTCCSWLFEMTKTKLNFNLQIRTKLYFFCRKLRCFSPNANTYRCLNQIKLSDSWLWNTPLCIDCHLFRTLKTIVYDNNITMTIYVNRMRLITLPVILLSG